MNIKKQLPEQRGLPEINPLQTFTSETPESLMQERDLWYPLFISLCLVPSLVFFEIIEPAGSQVLNAL
jgi:hypothetical protein